MYAGIEKYRERSLIQNIEDIQVKTILLYTKTKNMPDLLLKELTFALTSMYESLDNGVVKNFDYSRVVKILEHLTNYIKNRIADKYNLIDDFNLPSDIIQLKHICNMLEDKLIAKNNESLYQEEIEFIKSYKLYLLSLAYFLSDLIA